MEKEFACPICFDVCANAVETKCCHHIYCEACVASLRTCPECRFCPLACSPSIAIRRIIGNLPIQCPNDGCGKKTTMGNLKDHLMICTYQSFDCPAPGCKYTAIKDHFAYHLYTNHTDALVKRAANIFTANASSSASKPVPTAEVDRIAMTTNSDRRTARLGSTGKYYCTGRLGAPRCSCCNGDCGPTDGCNCAPCMKLDVISRKLPRGWFVNRDGFACRKGTTGMFYCGRKVMENDRNTDGYCGPTNGSNCFACQTIGAQYTIRYNNIWS